MDEGLEKLNQRLLAVTRTAAAIHLQLRQLLQAAKYVIAGRTGDGQPSKDLSPLAMQISDVGIDLQLTIHDIETNQPPPDILGAMTGAAVAAWTARILEREAENRDGIPRAIVVKAGPEADELLRRMAERLPKNFHKVMAVDSGEQQFTFQWDCGACSLTSEQVAQRRLCEQHLQQASLLWNCIELPGNRALFTGFLSDGQLAELEWIRLATNKSAVGP